MKKKIPKFDQKSWDEKQAKVAEEANGGGSSSSNPCEDVVNYYFGKLKNSQHVFGQDKLLIPTTTVPKDKLSAQFPPSGINSGAALRAKQLTGYLPYVPVGDPYDKYLFGGKYEPKIDMFTLNDEDGYPDTGYRFKLGKLELSVRYPERKKERNFDILIFKTKSNRWFCLNLYFINLNFILTMGEK